jgi:hypothetical protein
MKVLIFTEFVPTQAMLAGFLESRGFSVALLNGSMDLDTRAEGAAGVLERCSDSDFDRCRRRGLEPAVLPRHRQLRHAVEPDAH